MIFRHYVHNSTMLVIVIVYRLKEFLEDYDDLRDDPKYYKGSALARRMKARDLEASDDNRDRQKEKTEMEELKAKLKEEGHGDDSAEIIRLDENLSSHLRPMLHLATTAGASVPIDEVCVCLQLILSTTCLCT